MEKNKNKKQVLFASAHVLLPGQHILPYNRIFPRKMEAKVKRTKKANFSDTENATLLHGIAMERDVLTSHFQNAVT